MVIQRVKNTGKFLLFFFILTIVLVFFSPLLFENINVGLTMFFESSFWNIFFTITGLWFIFGILMYLRGWGRKGETA